MALINPLPTILTRPVKQLDVEKAGEEEEEEEEEAEPEVYSIDFGKASSAAALLEEICANHGDLDSSFELSKLLHKFWGEIHHEQDAGKVQTNLMAYFIKN
ncbi:hypothetical protein IW262DRAFT_1459214 [Armillaria fumosa]|nr:hypothetical protein IW262DRAFT_1459214 [Armillaria fumosa]